MIGGGYFQFGGIRFLYLLSETSGEDGCEEDRKARHDKRRRVAPRDIRP